MSLRKGDLLGGYRLDKSISANASAEVWLATSATFGTVLVKTLREDTRGYSDARERLLREGDCASRLTTTRVCRLLDRGDALGRPYLVLERLEGRTLADAFADAGTLSRTSFLALAEDLLSALVDVHAADVIHRDIKPANLFVTNEGETKLIDFGVARVGRGGDLTTQGTTLGSLAYAAPEQLREGGDVDARADLYGAGVVLFESLAGRTPFRAPNAPAVMALKLAARAPSLRDVTKQAFPDALETWLSRLLMRAPDARFASAKEALSHVARLPKW
jgi:serine/threonine-protein kinase